jgi:hypothetical protein
MKLHKKLHLLIWVVILCLAAPAGALALGDKAVIAASGARAYADSSLEGKSVKLKGYTIADLESMTGSAAEITYKGRTLYVDADLIMELDTADGEKKQLAKASRVYQYPSSSSRSVKLKKGTEVNLLAESGDSAIIEKNGNLAFVRSSALDDVKKDPEIIEDSFEAVVVKDNLKVYSKPNAKNKLGALDLDEHVTVTAYTDVMARIDFNGADGYCSISGLKKYVKPAPTIDDIFNNSGYSNEEKIFHYLTKIDGFSTAAACGILANIKCESGFRPDAYNPNGSSYGICQWLGGRYSNLKKYCQDNGLDYTSLKGQCLFLSYELENRYSSVYNYIKSVDPSAQGAYEAGYHWCYFYEIPANRSSVSVTRGNMAKDDFWPKYN